MDDQNENRIDENEQEEQVEKEPFNDMDDIEPAEIVDRMEYADQLRELAADIIAGRARTVVVFKYMHDDPHTLDVVGFFEGEGAKKHMLQDMSGYCQGELTEATPIYFIGGDEDEA